MKIKRHVKKISLIIIVVLNFVITILTGYTIINLQSIIEDQNNLICELKTNNKAFEKALIDLDNDLKKQSKEINEIKK